MNLFDDARRFKRAVTKAGTLQENSNVPYENLVKRKRKSEAVRKRKFNWIQEQTSVCFVFFIR